jgi:hypothetical protein
MLWYSSSWQKTKNNNKKIGSIKPNLQHFPVDYQAVRNVEHRASLTKLNFILDTLYHSAEKITPQSFREVRINCLSHLFISRFIRTSNTLCVYLSLFILATGCPYGRVLHWLKLKLNEGLSALSGTKCSFRCRVQTPDMSPVMSLKS